MVRTWGKVGDKILQEVQKEYPSLCMIRFKNDFIGCAFTSPCTMINDSTALTIYHRHFEDK